LARLNGIPADLVEDVVQETCLEAWRHLHGLREAERFTSWLEGICRNVCKRHLRALGKTAQHLYLGNDGDALDEAATQRLDLPVFDPSDALVREDRQLLLDQALSFLSTSAREVVELCYLEEAPHHEVAMRLGISIGALDVQLHRARRHLERIFSGALRAEATELGLLSNHDEALGWQEIRHWCVLCGKQRLRAAFEHAPSGEVLFRLRCPNCSKRYGFDLSGSGDITSFAGLQSLVPALKRGRRAAFEHFSTAVHQRHCSVCQSAVRVRVASRHTTEQEPLPVSSPVFPDRSFLIIWCPRCGYGIGDLVNGLLLDPVARAFAVDHPHVLIEPDIMTVYGGQDVLCSRLRDLDSSARLTLLAHPTTAQVIATVFE
jgi:RNA polymerase sigma-70 factor (ECF subfamily)